MRAYLNLRFTVETRTRAFEAGLRRCGYEVKRGTPRSISDCDLFVTWNRIGQANHIAATLGAAAKPVLVVENASWGNSFAGDAWYHIACGLHNTAGRFLVGADDRWDSLGIALPPIRSEGETVILPQRGIGSKPVAMPREWPGSALKRHGGRIRPHPGSTQQALKNTLRLDTDLANCGRVVTWGSGAAIKAALMGIPVVSEMPSWIAEHEPNEVSRLAMFRRLAWAQWRLEEIADGDPFRWLL